MPNLTRAALLSASCSFFLVTASVAQEKSLPITMVPTTSSIAARAALVSALEEVTNIGGGRRFDARLQAVIAADPNFGLGRAWYAGWSSTLTAAQRQTEFTRALKDATAANATTAELLFITGLRESRAGRNAIARDLFDIVLKLTPDDPDVTWARLLIAADADEARRIGEAGIKRFPEYAPIYNILAYRQNTDGRTEDALRTVARYVTLAPTHPNPEDSFAEILQLNGRYDEADAHYVKALEKDSRFDEALVGRAEIAALRGKFVTARGFLQQAIAIAEVPLRRQTLERNLASTYLYEGNLKDAKKVMTGMVAEGERHSLNTLPDKRTLAFIAALQGNSAEATRQYSAGKPETAGANLPLSDVTFHALLRHPAEVGTAVAAMEANAAKTPDNADTQQAMYAARVIGMVIKNDLPGARALQAKITNQGYKALSGAFLVQAAHKAGDAPSAKIARVDVDATRDLSLNAGLSRMIAQRK